MARKNTPPRFWPDRQLGGVLLNVADCLAEEPILDRRRRAAPAGGAVLSGRRPLSIAKSDCISPQNPQNFLRACGAAELPLIITRPLAL